MAKMFDPHPGLAGCMVRIPEAVRLVANELDGQDVPIAEAVAKIQAACPGGEVKDSPNHGMICLTVENFPGMQHSWRVIRYQEG